jgi:3-methyl-2-oxobutanoate hydroxymethyltransferase
MGHVGLTPQSVHAMGGFVVQGRDAASRRRIKDDAHALERAGAYAVVLEGIPADLAQELTAALSIPTIGIGAGVACDGQVLVITDLLGLNPDFAPKFVKRYLDGAAVIRGAVEAYVQEVGSGAFPAPEHSFGAAPASATGSTPERSPSPAVGKRVGSARGDSSAP